ncbi:F0F1 ATP synthase subunit epsilon [Alicyclobacillus tolerans]|uniref:F0F1 ATP synthase subunit epsilon n=1 Tax=Alicyclobacillus tolerans TaxID=90970 RepID=UPI001F315010|nr:F0F1 ATP synthase subunit epsilon [Alicyclobacillus tolerans]MCF8567161.1 F0F1 ATP synthase subunit epsilon [Alicyclobacillus tolerans]
MSTTLFEVVTPEHIVLSHQVNMVSLRGGGGELGILPRHTALATTVKAGVIKVKLPEGEDYVAVSDGFLQVLPDRITMLVDTAEFGGAVDIERAQQAKERAEKRLGERSDTVDTVRAEAALARALRRLQAAELSTKAGNTLERVLSGDKR